MSIRFWEWIFKKIVLGVVDCTNGFQKMKKSPKLCSERRKLKNTTPLPQQYYVQMAMQLVINKTQLSPQSHNFHLQSLSLSQILCLLPISPLDLGNDHLRRCQPWPLEAFFQISNSLEPAVHVIVNSSARGICAVGTGSGKLGHIEDGRGLSDWIWISMDSLHSI